METPSSRNLAARAGGWSARHWKRAFFGWLLFVAAAVLLGMWVGLKPLSDADQASGEAGRAAHILDRAGFKLPATESVLIQSRTATIDHPAFVSAIGGVAQMVSMLSDVTNVRNPLLSPATQTSRDGHSALVQFDIKGARDDAKRKVEAMMDMVRAVAQANPNFRIE
jgi:hypothetical protein